METDKVFDENGRGFTRVFTSDFVERVDPNKYFREYELKKRATVLRDLLQTKNEFLTSLLDDDFFLKHAEESLVGFFERYQNTPFNENLLEVFKTERKKDQVKLLKATSLTPSELASLIFKAYNDYGFTYSKYLFENLPQGFEKRKLPKLFQLKEDGTIEKSGETDLTDGELKQVIEQRKVIVSNFFDKDDIWHCFFATYNGLSGKENWKDGQPHFHYISSAFGISREDFLESMKTGDYRSTPIHIDLLEYGQGFGTK